MPFPLSSLQRRAPIYTVQLMTNRIECTFVPQYPGGVDPTLREVQGRGGQGKDKKK